MEIRVWCLLDAARTPLIFLAVHPPDLKGVLSEIRGAVSSDSFLLSLAPRITIKAIQSALGVMRVVRMIPNAPSAIGRGFDLVAYAPEVDARTVERLRGVFGPRGESPEVPERQLEAYAIASAMGPIYMWFQWQALRELAAGFGLVEEEADEAILKTVVGGAECMLAHGLSSGLCNTPDGSLREVEGLK